MGMDCFLDIELRRDPEFPDHQLLAALYAKLHRVLLPNNTANIAVCFPGHQLRPPSLGKGMRLFGSSAALLALISADWLKGVRDHTKVGDIADVPADVACRALRRVQTKSNPERLRRRLMKRHGLNEGQARERIPDSAAEMLNLPFVQLHSHSTGQQFRLFLSLGPEQPTASPGDFNAYGLSRTATIPWF
jgi:CRISPR-associated endonuclease Csy4